MNVSAPNFLCVPVSTMNTIIIFEGTSKTVFHLYDICLSAYSKVKTPNNNRVQLEVACGGYRFKKIYLAEDLCSHL